jgi:hypothetical protein
MPEAECNLPGCFLRMNCTPRWQEAIAIKKKSIQNIYWYAEIVCQTVFKFDEQLQYEKIISRPGKNITISKPHELQIFASDN